MILINSFASSMIKNFSKSNDTAFALGIISSKASSIASPPKARSSESYIYKVLLVKKDKSSALMMVSEGINKSQDQVVRDSVKVEPVRVMKE